MANDSKLANLADVKAAFDDVNSRAGVTGVKGNAETTYRHGNVNLTPANIGAAKANEQITVSNSNIDLTKSNNNISSDVWMSPVAWADKNNKEYADVQGYARANGNTSLYLGVRNFDSNGTAVANKGITLSADKSGNLLYSFPDSHNARAALGVPAAIQYRDNIDNLRTSGIYYLAGATGTGATENGFYGMLQVCSNDVGDRAIQLFIDIWSDTVKFRRYSGSWSNWKTFTLS